MATKSFLKNISIKNRKSANSFISALENAEKKSKKKPDYKYTYGCIRYSVLGALLTTTF